MEEGVEEIPLGLYLVKGDMMYVPPRVYFSRMYVLMDGLLDIRVLIGEIDDAVDQAVDLSTIHAEPIPPIRY